MMEYREITTIADWGSTLSQSARPTVVFKHSTTCPISAAAHREFQRYLAGQANPDTDYVLVKVIESREVSNQISADLGIQHESPQAILIRDGRAVWNASHFDITERALTEIV